MVKVDRASGRDSASRAADGDSGTDDRRVAARRSAAQTGGQAASDRFGLGDPLPAGRDGTGGWHLRTPAPVPDPPRAHRGVIDTSVVIDLEQLEAGQLPIELAVSAITMAELAAGPHATGDTDERARRQDRLQRPEAAFDPLPFDAEAARAHGRTYAAEVGSGRKARGTRALDLLIAATACGAGLPFSTRNPEDFESLLGLVDVVAA